MKKVLSLVLFGALTACVTTKEEERAPSLQASKVAALLPSDLKDRNGWAKDILFAFDRLGLSPDAGSVICLQKPFRPAELLRAIEAARKIAAAPGG